MYESVVYPGLAANKQGTGSRFRDLGGATLIRRRDGHFKCHNITHLRHIKCHELHTSEEGREVVVSPEDTIVS